MGVTSNEIGLLSGYISGYNIKSVIELGAQNNYSHGDLPAPYMRKWYEDKGIQYSSIDLTGECGAAMLDLGKLITNPRKYDMVTDFGTSEHVSDDGNSYGTGKFSWESIYNCWLNKFNLCKVGGIIFSVNPKTGNWPGHGFQFFTFEFYNELIKMAGLDTLSLSEFPAMGNSTDGWNIISIMQKVSDKFPSLEQFKTLDLRRQ